MEFTKAVGFKGYYPDLPSDMCPEGALIVGSKNFRIVNGVLEARAGKELLQAAAVEGVPLLLHTHEDITGTKRLVLATTTDIYYWHDANVAFEFLTPRYVAGQVACAGSATTVEGTGTDFVTADINQYDQIKFDTNDVDGTGTPDVWYTIDSRTDLDTLELTEDGPDTSGDVDYVIRKVLAAATNYRWRVVDYYDGNADENLLILTNGTDVVQKWDPDNAYVEDLGGDPPKAKEVGQLGGRLVFGNITAVTGTGTALPYTLIWSAVADAEKWTEAEDAGYQELYRTSGEVKFLASWGAFLVVAKEDCLVLLRPTGSADDPLDTDYMVMSGGSLTSVFHVMEKGVIYLAKDDVLVFDGTPVPKSIAHGKVADAIFDNLNHTKRYLITAAYSPRYKEWRLSVPSVDSDYPDRTFVYRIKEDEWQYDDVGFIALGAYNYKTETTIDELTDPIDSYDNPIDEWSATGAFDEIICADENGYVYIERHILKQDNGVDIAFVAVTADNVITSLDQVERIQQSLVHYKGTSAAADVLTAQLSVDGGSTYKPGQSFNNDESAIRRRAKQSWNAAGRTARLMFTGRQASLLAYRFGYEPEGDR